MYQFQIMIKICKEEKDEGEEDSVTNRVEWSRGNVSIMRMLANEYE